MQLKPLGRLVLCAMMLLIVVPFARADRSSGTWTGELLLRGNYYWEESSRVVAPAIGVSLESPTGVRLHADYLLDSITSASQAAGAVVDVAFNEIRHDIAFGGGYEFELSDETSFELNLSTRISYEPDYRSYGVTLSSALYLNQRATTLRFGVTVIRDSVRQLFRGSGTGPAGGPANRGEIGQLLGLVPTLSIDQVLTPILTLQVGYDYGYLDGYLANPYRQVPVEGLFQPEAHPETRHRHTLYGRLAVYSRPSRTAFHLMYKAYIDSWEIAAFSPELRIYQEFGDYAQLRTRYRYYHQSRAFFGLAPEEYSPEDQYVTADPKMRAFESHLLELQVALFLKFVDGTPLAFLRDASLDLTFAYMWSTSRYGDAVIGQVGARIPF